MFVCWVGARRVAAAAAAATLRSLRTHRRAAGNWRQKKLQCYTQRQNCYSVKHRDKTATMLHTETKLIQCYKRRQKQIGLTNPSHFNPILRRIKISNDFSTMVLRLLQVDWMDGFANNITAFAAPPISFNGHYCKNCLRPLFASMCYSRARFRSNPDHHRAHADNGLVLNCIHTNRPPSTISLSFKSQHKSEEPTRIANPK